MMRAGGRHDAAAEADAAIGVAAAVQEAELSQPERQRLRAQQQFFEEGFDDASDDDDGEAALADSMRAAPAVSGRPAAHAAKVRREAGEEDVLLAARVQNAADAAREAALGDTAVDRQGLDDWDAHVGRHEIAPLPDSDWAIGGGLPDDVCAEAAQQQLPQRPRTRSVGVCELGGSVMGPHRDLFLPACVTHAPAPKGVKAKVR